MARNEATQLFNTVVQHDYGIVTLSAAGVGSVLTNLSQVHSGLAVQRSGHTFASSLQVSALSGQTVTITDPQGANNGGAVVSYDLLGV